MADLDCRANWCSRAGWDSTGDGTSGYQAVMAGLSLLQGSAMTWELTVLGWTVVVEEPAVPACIAVLAMAGELPVLAVPACIAVLAMAGELPVLAVPACIAMLAMAGELPMLAVLAGFAVLAPAGELPVLAVLAGPAVLTYGNFEVLVKPALA